ncbi:hypothetical protein ACIQRW_10650 [Streptomyces sp. NPDC091287]|uniref:hypothetical protein n=1 Tax=Streptomyces sp. NPDC091287 TaxID=3365988 RepID=UPI00380A546A
MAWDEWEQLKAEAAERHTVQVRLNQVGEDPGGGLGGIRSSKASWTHAGESVGKLAGDARKALSALKHEQSGAAISADVLSGAAQKDVYQSWSKYIAGMRDRCVALQGLLEKTGNDQFKNDDAIRAAFDGLAKKYEDTDGGGPDSRAR